MSRRGRASYGSNEEIPEPRSPGEWVDPRRCHVCGDRYGDFRAGSDCGFDQGVAAVRSANGGFEEGGGWRSRGPVLWAMHTCKLNAWYLEHLPCGEWWDGEFLEEDEEAGELPWESDDLDYDEEDYDEDEFGYDDDYDDPF